MKIFLRAMLVIIGVLAQGELIAEERCEFDQRLLVAAINGDEVALHAWDEYHAWDIYQTRSCRLPLFFIGSALRFAYPRTERDFVQNAYNLSANPLESAYSNLGYAIYLHAKGQCNSSIAVLDNLRRIGIESTEVIISIYLKAIRYGDFNAARSLASRLRDTKDPGHLRMASQIFHFLSLNPAAKRLAAGNEYLAKMLPPPDTEDLDMAWIADVPASTKGLCAKDSE